MFAVEAAAVDEAADTAHGTEGIGEQRLGLKSKCYTEVNWRHKSWPQESPWLNLQQMKQITHTLKLKNNDGLYLNQSFFHESTNSFWCFQLFSVT